MLDKQFTIISGSTCIVVLLMLLARTDAAPQVGEIDAMQETVTGAPSDSPIYSVYQVHYYGINYATKQGFKCKFDVTSDKCRLEVGKRKGCLIKLAKDQGPDCQALKQTTVNFNQASPHRLTMEELQINGVVPFYSKGTDIRAFTNLNGRKGKAGLAQIFEHHSENFILVFMEVVRS
eukprot:Nk52_evm1s178 gene=Nk52_evmTU1s178